MRQDVACAGAGGNQGMIGCTNGLGSRPVGWPEWVGALAAVIGLC